MRARTLGRTHRHALRTVLQRYASISVTDNGKKRKKNKTKKHPRQEPKHAPHGRPRFRAGSASPGGKLVDALAVPLARFYHRHLVLAAAAAFITSAALATATIATLFSSGPFVGADAAAAAAAACCRCARYRHRAQRDATSGVKEGRGQSKREGQTQ